jgi:hypothetical protein
MDKMTDLTKMSLSRRQMLQALFQEFLRSGSQDSGPESLLQYWRPRKRPILLGQAGDGCRRCDMSGYCRIHWHKRSRGLTLGRVSTWGTEKEEIERFMNSITALLTLEEMTC